MSIKTLDELLAEGVEGRGVLVRSDLNVPLDENGNITDPGRIIASVPTLAALADAGAKGNAAANASQFVVYPDAPHAFHADYRASFRKEAAEDGWKRALAWFKANGVA